MFLDDTKGSKLKLSAFEANEHLQMAISKHDEFILNKDGKFYAEV